MTRLTIAFLGAGKRLSLMERFLEAARRENVELSLVSIEAQERVPVAQVARILKGPRFGSPQFAPHLLATVAQLGVNAVIPMMDAATTVLSPLRDQLRELGCTAVVSDPELCRVMEDKILADEYFRGRSLPVPEATAWPLIAKHRTGFGSRDQAILADKHATDAFFSTHKLQDYIVQSMVLGQEYTVDAFVTGDGRIVAVLSRKRLEVSAGEVDVSETHRHPQILELSRQILSTPGWRGPITLQFIAPDSAPDRPVLIEINPRFGGGVTHSIHCGLDMPAWIIRELLARPVVPMDQWPDGSFMTRCRRDVFL